MLFPLMLVAAAVAGGIYLWRKRGQDGPKLITDGKPPKEAEKRPPPKPKAPVPPKKPKLAGADGLHLIPSAIRSVSSPEWTKFVSVMASGEPKEIDEYYRLGLFRASMRRLHDLGLVHNLRRGTWPPMAKDGKTVWMGDFRPPMSMEKFLGNLKAQYRVFVKDMVEHVKYLEHNHKNALGRLIMGQPVTMSGLLVVAKLAGDKGVKSWLESDEIRRKFPGTTSAFQRTNGIF